MSEIHIFIDDKMVKTRTGISVLEAALTADIYIPHLCFWIPEDCASHELSSVADSFCRLCFVEIEGQERPVCACEQAVYCGMRITTRGVHARRLTLTAFKLLMAEHELSCSACVRNAEEEFCEFKKIAKWLGTPLKTKWLLDNAQAMRPKWVTDGFEIKREKCVHCGRCIHVCKATENSLLGFAARSLDTYVFYGGGIDDVEDLCAKCQKCMLACPAGAIEIQSLGDKKEGRTAD